MNFNKTPLITVDTQMYDFYSVECVTEYSRLGIVGYASVNKENGDITNFVMSCRALGFGLEEEFYIYVKESAQGIFKFIKSERNKVAELLMNKMTNTYGNDEV